MAQYRVSYISTMDGDCCRVLVEADSREDAIKETYNEYWDIEKIIGVCKL